MPRDGASNPTMVCAGRVPIHTASVGDCWSARWHQGSTHRRGSGSARGPSDGRSVDPYSRSYSASDRRLLSADTYYGEARLAHHAGGSAKARAVASVPRANRSETHKYEPLAFIARRSAWPRGLHPLPSNPSYPRRRLSAKARFSSVFTLASDRSIFADCALDVVAGYAPGLVLTRALTYLPMSCASETNASVREDCPYARARRASRKTGVGAIPPRCTVAAASALLGGCA